MKILTDAAHLRLEERAVLALERIAEAIERLMETTSPANQWTRLDDMPDEASKQRSFYTNEDQDIVAENLRRMGKEPKNV